MRGSLVRWIGGGLVDFRGKNRIARALYDPERIVGRAFTVDYFGKRYSGNTAEYVDWNVYVYGGAERAAIAELRRLIATTGEQWMLFDVGANAGTYTLPFVDLVTSGYAFEPVAETRQRLQRNLAVNDVDRIEVDASALGAADGTAQIYVASGHSNRGTSSLDAGYNLTNDRAETVTVRTLDSYLSALGPERALFVKIDVEGTELQVLRGAARLAHFKVLLMIETIDPDVLALLKGWGFAGVSIYNDYARLRRYPLDTTFENHILSNFMDVG